MNNQLRSKLQPVRNGLRIQRLMKATIPGFVVGGALALLSGALGWLAGSAAATYVGMGLMIAVPAAAAIWSFFRPPTWVEAARAVDRHFNLHDRTVTAVELADAGSDPWKEMQLQEALHHLDRIRPAGAAGTAVRYDRLLIALALNLAAAGVFTARLWLPATSNMAATPSRQQPLEKLAARRPAPTTVAPELVEASIAALQTSTGSPNEDHPPFSVRPVADRYFDLLEEVRN